MAKNNRSFENNGFTTRAARLEDVDRIVDLINAAALVDTGRVATNREDQLLEWGLPYFNIETDAHLVLAPEGLVGFVQLWDSEPYVRNYQFGRVHPDYRGQGIGKYLVEWAETRARQSLDEAPPGARVSIHTATVRENQAAHELFELNGYTPSRHFFSMLTEMTADTPPSPPVWPEGVTVRPYALGQDDRTTHQTINEAFKDHWGYVEGETFEEWFHWIEADENFDPSVCFLAVTNGVGEEEIVGALMARSEWEQDPSIAWIDELGVLRPWRRKGVALALLHQVFGEFHSRGKYKVGLGVDGDSLTGATKLYERAGMRIFEQRDAYQKILRPGVDISTQSLEE